MSTPVQIIKSAYGSIKEISRITGMNYETLLKNRMRDDRIANLTLGEFWLLQRHAEFSDSDLLTIIKWRAGSE